LPPRRAIMPLMEFELAARRLAELGNPTRLKLFHTLVRMGCEGASIGALRQASGLAASTLAFHLRGLVNAGLVEQRRAGRSIFCFARIEAVEDVARFLRRECCADLSPTDHKEHAA
jgi:DNA-binding transcriptional ArsR family regulator